MTPMYYEHALFMEGRAAETSMSPSNCKLIVAKLDGPEAALVRVTEVRGWLWLDERLNRGTTQGADTLAVQSSSQLC